MLILSMRPEETICVGENVEVVLLAIRGGQIRVGFKAPKDIRIDRKSVRLRKDAEKETP